MKKTIQTSERVIDRILKERQDANACETLECGVWYSGFNTVKATAIANGVPLISVWTNGDVCALCKRFETCLSSETFKAWMKKQRCLFSFGWSGDTKQEDRVTAKNWSWGTGHKLKAYPFMRVYLQNEIDDARTGDQWDGRKSDDAGAALIISKLDEVLKATSAS